MARQVRKDPPEGSGEIKQKDFDLAVKLYKSDILPAQGKVGEYAQEMSTAYKAMKKQAHIQPGAAKLAFKIAEMEEAKRDDFLRGLNGLLKKLGIDPDPKDMVDAMQVEQRPKPKLVTVPATKGPFDANPPIGPDGDTDLNPDD